MAELQSTSQTTNRSSPVDDHKKEDSTHDQENFSPPVTSRNTSHDETVSPGSSSTRSSGFGSRSFPLSSDHMHESPTVLNTLHPKIFDLQGEISQISSQIHGVKSSLREPCMKIDEKVSLMEDKVTTLENTLAEVSKNVATILQCVRPQNRATGLREDSFSSGSSVPSLLASSNRSSPDSIRTSSLSPQDATNPSQDSGESQSTHDFTNFVPRSRLAGYSYTAFPATTVTVSNLV